MAWTIYSTQDEIRQLRDVLRRRGAKFLAPYCRLVLDGMRRWDDGVNVGLVQLECSRILELANGDSVMKGSEAA